MNKRVIVTGACGFLGSHISMRHLNVGDTVIGIDDFSTSLGSSAPHVIELLNNRKFIFIEADVIETLAWRDLSVRDIDVIYNFACPASPPKYQANPIGTMMTCVLGATNAFKCGLNNKCPVVHASTSEIYGDPLVTPQSESYRGNVNPYGIRSCYDEGKRAAEALAFDFKNKHNADIRIVRIFNTYGPHMDPDDGRVVTNFIKQALLNEPMTVYGDGNQTRSFCYQSDLVDAITEMATLASNPNTPINIGNPKEFTMLELIDVIDSFFMRKSNIEFRELPSDDPVRRCPDITLAKNILNFNPKVNLFEGISLTTSYLKKELQRQNRL